MTNGSKQILRSKQVIKRLNISRSKFWDMIRNGQFLKPIHLSTRARGWIEGEVDAWIEARRG